MDEDDLYGSLDIGHHVEEDVPSQRTVGGGLPATSGKLDAVEAQLRAARAELEQWRQAVQQANVSDPSALSAELRRLHTAENSFNDELAAVRKREAALALQLAEKNIENIELRRHLQTARQAADPTVVQVRQLMLDPAVHREFQRLKKELEERQKEIKQLQEDMQAVQFSQESKAGRMLMAKCRALQDENEEMGKELAEGRVHQLERQLAVGKEYVEEMRRAYGELEDHAGALDQEAEDAQQQVYLLRRQLQEQLDSKDFAGPEYHHRSLPGRKPFLSNNRGMSTSSMERKRTPGSSDKYAERKRARV